MLHSNTERLIDYWRERKSERLSPLRADINPGDFTELLPQVFILGRAAPGEHQFRLAGGYVSALHGKDLRRVEFLSLWNEAHRPSLAAALEAARRTAEPLIVIAEARFARGLTARLELLLAPLRADAWPLDRLIGLYQPLTPMDALRGETAIELGLIRIGSSIEDERPALRLAAVDGRRLA